MDDKPKLDMLELREVERLGRLARYHFSIYYTQPYTPTRSRTRPIRPSSAAEGKVPGLVVLPPTTKLVSTLSPHVFSAALRINNNI